MPTEIHLYAFAYKLLLDASLPIQKQLHQRSTDQPFPRLRKWDRFHVRIIQQGVKICERALSPNHDGYHMLIYPLRRSHDP